MNLEDMRTFVRRDLHDEDSNNFRWTDDEIDRHIARALKEFSEAVPLEEKATFATISGSREISVSTLTDRIMIEAVEYPVGEFPLRYVRFGLWNDILTLLGEMPDGSDCCVYYGKLHTLDITNSTLPAKYEDLVAAGAAGYAAQEWGIHSINKVNQGGVNTPEEFSAWGKEKLDFFRTELKRLGRRNRVRIGQLYIPCHPPASQSTDWGP